MYPLSKKYWQILLLAFSTILFSCAPALQAQSFRGGINGTVVDASGAAVPQAAIVVTNDGTAVARDTVSSSAGEFSFHDLPVGSYTLTITASGFTTEKVDKVTVSAGSVYTVPIKLSVSSSVQVVNVNAATVALDTTTTTQTTDIPTQVVNNVPNNGRDFTQLLQFTPGFGGYSLGGGAGVASVNGTRSNQVNWQIEGTDNNDLWWNIPAVNQGGVSGIAGIVLPLDAIDQFSFVTSGTPESGRNAGGTVNLSIKSGTNQLHGTAYYFNRNEFFSAETPFAPLGAEKNKTRDISYGFSVGGPIWKDKTFFFVTFEHQNFVIGNQTVSTEPSAAYQRAAIGLLDKYGVPHNTVSQALLTNLWPSSALTGPANSQNYFNPGTENGHSFNGIVKIDHNFNASNQLSVKWYAGQGSQIAPTSSYLTPFYEVAPIHVQNYSVTYNHVFTPAIANQVFAGVSYFNQVFSDQVHSYDPVALGLNTGVTSADLSGAPHISIAPPAAGSGLTGNASGFDQIGPTAPSGRNDITGHLDDALSYTVGRHQFRFGGEYRQAQVDDFYQTNARGNFTFDGSQGPWNAGAGSSACDALATNKGATNTVTDGNVYLLADFLAGCVSSSFIAEGNQKRQVFENTFDLFGQDAWQLTEKFNLNYGVRYDFADSVHNPYNNLSSFDPSFSTGFAVQGSNVDHLYSPFKGAVSPRVGGAYALSNSLVLRAGFGMYFDTPYMLPLLNLRGTTDSGALGIGNNPGGADPVATAAADNYVIAPNKQIFPTLATSLAGVLTGVGGTVTSAYSVNPSYRQSYTYSYNVNAQQSLGSGIIAQLGYVGTLSRHLTEVQDINAAAVGSGFVTNPVNLIVDGGVQSYSYQQSTRPFFSQFKGIGTVNQLESNLNSNYNSLQAILKTSLWHGLTTQATYTWSHALDYETGLVPYLPQNSLDVKAEYSNSDFDTRNTFTAYANYAAPNSRFGPKLLMNGWESNAALSFHGGQPFSVIASSNTSGNGDNADRAQLVAGVNPFDGVSHRLNRSTSGSNVQWFSPTAFVDPTQGTFSTTRRNLFYNPGYEDVDLSVFKNTKIGERINTQFRVEMFNLFNHLNLAPSGAPQTGEGGTIASTFGTYEGAPGIGPGEPFNTQFALKVIF